MNKQALCSLCLALVLVLFGSAASALSVPERLVYDVSWSGLGAGTAVQEVTSLDGELHIVYTVRSSGLVNAFFPIDDREESVLSRGSGAHAFGSPRLYREKINEGKTHTVKEAHFDLARLKVDTKDFLNNTEKSDAISAKTFDTLSSIYFIRSSGLAPGVPVSLEIFDCKRLWNAEVRVVQREKVATPVGRFNALVVTTDLKAEGVKPRPAYMKVWLSDDDLRIPVKIAIKLKMGELTATLSGGSHWQH